MIIVRRQSLKSENYSLPAGSKKKKKKKKLMSMDYIQPEKFNNMVFYKEKK